MSNALIVAAYLATGLLNLLPVAGVLGAFRLNKLYGLTFDEPNLLVLMRHRALLFGLIGDFLIAAAFIPAWRLPAGLMGALSMAGFIALARLYAPLNAALRRVVIADWVGLALLLPALALGWFVRAPHAT